MISKTYHDMKTLIECFNLIIGAGRVSKTSRHANPIQVYVLALVLSFDFILSCYLLINF